MSGPAPQEHSHLKVLHDFQYKTAEDREIIIKKNERLYLIQKTNDDWWQVVRNLEQRSFYVPATYVRELSKTSSVSSSSTRKNSEEDRDNIFEPPQNLSYKSMPRESSNAMRNVKKWLAGAMDGKLESNKTFYGSETHRKTDVGDGSKIHGNVGSMEQKTKSLERELRPEQFSDREEDGSHDSPRSRESLDYHENSTKINRLSTSPKNIGLQFRMEPSLQDPFRRELESSLDRRNLVGKIVPRVRTRSSNSEGGPSNTENAISDRETLNKSDKEIFAKSDSRKMNLSVHEETRRDSESSSGNNSRNSRSLDFEGNKFLSTRRERSTSPKPFYVRQHTVASSQPKSDREKMPDDDDENDDKDDGSTTTSDQKILNDKRRTWAVEELMSELTQMCKERVVNKKPNFQLKSTEIKSNFDPIEKLTREIHEMNRLRTETNVSEISNPGLSRFNGSPINVCKIAINSERPTTDHRKSIDGQRDADVNSSMATEKFDTFVESRRRCPSVTQTDVESSKPLKSPKSPKILDEYNEANILNDCNTRESTSVNSTARSLSPDKQSHYRKLDDSVVVDNVVIPERCCYSNVKVNVEKIKLRPKLKIKIMEPTAELRLTPSLEKLASEIQFLPAKRTAQTEIIRKKSMSEEKKFPNAEDSSKSDDSLERRRNRGILKHGLDYKGSFKTKREEMYNQRENANFSKISDSTSLKKSNTMHCATIPDCYRRFRSNRVDGGDSTSMNIVAKRRSRSLSDLEIINFDNDDDEKKIMMIPRIPRCKPVPMPRTKLPGLKNLADTSKDRMNEKFDSKMNNVDASRTIPQQRKISREKRDLSRDDDGVHRHQPYDHNSTNYRSLGDTSSNNFHGSNYSTRNVNIDTSTAVGFKSLLCASDSGSDNCLQSKDLLSCSTGNLTESRSVRPTVKSRSSVNFNDGNGVAGMTRESLSDEQILSSNASSEALHSQSESEVTATTLDVSSQPSPAAESEQDGFECAAISLPPGWIQKYDSDTGQICFINEIGNKWFSSNDAEGKIYFFEENSNESSWVLPTAHPEKSLSSGSDGKNEKIDVNGSSTSEPKDSGTSRSNVSGNTSVPGRDLSTKKSGPTGGDWPHLHDGNNMLVLKEGVINRTKITENGKKLRKNWSTSYAVLTELFLLFFKDAKTFGMMKMGQSSGAKPDISVDLNGALVEHGDRASSRKNVYMISTVLGLQVLIQSDNTTMSNEWFQEVHAAIRKLPSGFKSHGKLAMATELRLNSGNKQIAEANQSEDSKRSSKVARSRSMKMKRLDDSLEDLSGSAAERQTKIKAKLRWFFQRRPAVELLVKNGIYKDEPAFGSYLSDVCPTEAPRVPLFVKTCIEVLESKEENMKTDGLYRASGNLSQIQKIRLQVDQYKLDVLGQEEDVHVLTGALKLFFRELKEPLIPSTFFKEAVNASMLKKSPAKIQCFRDIAKALPPPNYDTLQFLLKHLLRVTSYQEFNRMHIPNLAIVFGPTLMWPAEESANMALDFMQQNFVIECLLSEYNKIFK